MRTISRLNLIAERLIPRIQGLFYLFKDRLKKPPEGSQSLGSGNVSSLPWEQGETRGKKRWRRLVWLVLLVSGCWVLVSAHLANAAIPKYITFQGRLTDTAGTPVADGNYSVTFRIYDTESGGEALWTETQTVSVSNGVFTVALGTVTSLGSLSFDTEYWLSVQVESDAEMSPRQRVTAAGYALNADSLDAYTSSQFLRSDADDTASGQLTLTYPGSALIVQPSTAPAADSKLVQIKDTAGTSKFSVDYEGDTTIAGTLSVSGDATLGGDLTVTGTISGSTTISGTTYKTWTIDSDATGTEPAAGAGLIIEGGSGDASILWDATNDELDINKAINISGQATIGTDLTVTSGMRVGTGSTPDNITALADDTLFVEGDAEIDGTLYVANITSTGTTLGDITDVGDATSGAAFTADGDGTTLYFEGATADAFEQIIGTDDPTADRTFNFPDDSLAAGDVLVGDGAGSLAYVGLADTQILIGDGSGAPNAASLSGDVTMTNTGVVTVTHTLDDAFDDGNIIDGASATKNVVIGDGSDALEIYASGGGVYIETQGSADLTIAPDGSDTTITGDVLIDTTGADELGDLGTEAADASTALAVATNPTANEADGVLKLGRNDGSWEYIHFDTSLAAGGGKFVFSAPLKVKGATPASIEFDDGSGTTHTLTYDSTAETTLTWSDELAANAFNVVGGSPAALNFGTGSSRISLIYDPDTEEIRFTRGVFSHDFRNYVKNGSFEAFSALEEFHDYDPNYATASQFGGVYDTTAGYQGGWTNFAPDEWEYVSGDVFQQAPTYFESGFTSADIDSSTYARDFAEGLSAVRLAHDGTNPGMIQQVIKNLKPSTLYSVGVKMRVEADGTARVDILGEDTATSTTLAADLDATSTKEILVNSVANFPSYGQILIDSERISYGGLDTTNNKFIRLTRGVENTTAAAHTSGAPVRIAPFQPIVLSSTTATEYARYDGQFATDPAASEITIRLSAEAGVAYFDTVQIVAGGTVPEYAPNTLVDTGDQTIYGSLRIGRTSDEKGGILSVDKYVRTRGVELFTDDPGLSGALGGGGTTLEGSGIFPPGDGFNESTGQLASVQLYVQGTYSANAPPHREYKVQIEDGGTTFSWWYKDDTTGWALVSGGSGVAMPVSAGTAAALNAGVEVWFSTSPGTAGDTWYFGASNQEAYGGYDSYAETVSYIKGETRIYKDPNPFSPYFNKLVFKDGALKVSLEELAASVERQSVIEPASPGSTTYGLGMDTYGNYTGTDNRSYWVEIDGTGTAGTSSDTFKWSNDGGQTWAATGVSITGTDQLLEDGIYVYFWEQDFTDDGTITGGAVGDYWTFNVLAGTTAAAKVETLNTRVGGVDGTPLSGNVLLEQGANIILTQDTTNNLIQIAASLEGAGQWSDAGSYIYANNATDVVVTDTGRVGIGTTAPAEKLTVKGGPVSFLRGTNLPFAFSFGRASAEGRLAVAASAGQFAASTQPGDVILRTDSDSASLFLATGAQDGEVVISGDNVGIGTTSPAYTLDVAGTINASTAIKVAGTDVLTSEVDGDPTNELQNLFSKIAVSGQSDVDADSQTDTLTLAAGTNITLTTDAATDTVTIAATDTDTTLAESDVETYIANDVATNYIPRDNGTKLVTGTIFDNGTNIGIGTTSPSSALEVVGTITATTFSGGGLDADDVTLADVQAACSSDFHNIGGIDDDVPDSGDLGLIDTEAEFEAELFAIVTPGEDDDIPEAGDFGAATDLDANGAILPDAVALGTDTTGNYVATVVDGTGIDGTAAGEGATYTPSLDLTELASLTWSDGTSSSFTHTYDVSTGTDPVLYLGNNTFAIQAGNVGIGTTAPVNTLTVDGNVYFREVISNASGDNWLLDNYYNISTGNTGNYWSLYNRNIISGSDISDAAGIKNEAVFQNANGSFANLYGIYNEVHTLGSNITGSNLYGTYNYVYVFGASGSSFDNLYGNYVTMLKGNDTVNNAYGFYVADITSVTNNAFAIYTAGATKSYFGGNVGIGTTSPSVKLQVGSGTPGSATAANSAYIVGDLEVDGVIYGDGSGLTNVGSGAIADDSLDWAKFADAMTLDATTTIDMDTNAADLNFDTGTLFIDSSTSRVGIGTTSPSAKLDVVGDLEVSGTITQAGSGLIDGTGTANYTARFSDSNTLTTGVLYDDGTNVGIGTTAPDTTLDVNGDVTFGGGDIGLTGDYPSGHNWQDYNIFASSGGTLGIHATTGDLDVWIDGGLTVEGGSTRIDWRAASNIDAQLGRADTARYANILYANSKTFGSSKQWAVGLRPADSDYHIYSDGNNFEAATFKQTGDVILAPTQGNVGIGTTAPAEKLHVFGGGLRIDSPTESVFITGDTYLYLQPSANTRFRLGVWDTSAGALPLTLQDSGGNVGIGTTAPAYKLDVAGSLSADSLNINDAYTLPTTDGTANYVLKTDGAGTVSWAEDAGGVTIAGTDNYLARFNAAGDNVEDSGIVDNSNALALTIDASENVGIGTTSPAYTLDVAGTINASTAVKVNGTDVLTSETQSLDDAYNNGSSITVDTTDVIWNLTSTQDFHIQDSGSSVFTVTDAGNVGIGTTGPASALHVKGDITLSGGSRTIATTASGESITIQAVGNSSSLTLTAGRYLNIGLTEIDGLRMGRATTGASTLLQGGAITIRSYQSATNAIQIQDSSANTILDIDTINGNVGIGTTNPAQKLHVVGDVKLTGRIRQGSLGDLAEMMTLASCILNPATQPLASPEVIATATNEQTPLILKDKEEYARYLLERPEAGDVVVIDEDGGVRRSYAAYATNTAGIVSTNPAQILRDGLENAVPVALNGIVPCKVSAEGGPIKPGDLLVSSSTPGHAMRAGANPPPGTVIGKALSHLEEGEEVGVVEVLVMLK